MSFLLDTIHLSAKYFAPSSNTTANDSNTQWHQLLIRSPERGELYDSFTSIPVWTIYNEEAVKEWLVIRRESNGRCSYSLSNASDNTPLTDLAWWKCQRYFVER